MISLSFGFSLLTKDDKRINWLELESSNKKGIIIHLL
jgi:hypothetical protein